MVDGEKLDSSALFLVLVTQSDLQMRELEIETKIDFENLRLEQEKLKIEQGRQMQKGKVEMEERIQKEKLEKKEENERERQFSLRMKKLEMQNKTVKPQPLGFTLMLPNTSD